MNDDKGWCGNFFEDFVLHTPFPCPTPRTISSGDVSNYIAFTGDRTPRFCAADGRVHPLIVFHVVLGQTVRQISLNARANLGYASMIWSAPVSVGDTITTEAEIIGLKENSSGVTGIAWVRTTATNQRAETVLSYIRWVMVKKRNHGAPTTYRDAPVVPEVQSAVRPDQLRLDACFSHRFQLPRSTQTGGRFWFEDYGVGERVFHHDGVSINPSDHMSFTRLFQNSAKVHFDNLLTDGKPLVYGGVPISFGYAQAFNGLENRLGICAVNGGSHSNPVYAGDTLYSFTEVIESAPLGSQDPVGALRLRLIVTVNSDPSRTPEMPIKVENPKRPGRQMHNPKVVLDLDFWELIPKRPAV